jgi:hypothetical protein
VLNLRRRGARQGGVAPQRHAARQEGGEDAGDLPFFVVDGSMG